MTLFTADHIDEDSLGEDVSVKEIGALSDQQLLDALEAAIEALGESGYAPLPVRKRRYRDNPLSLPDASTVSKIVAALIQLGATPGMARRVVLVALKRIRNEKLSLEEQALLRNFRRRAGRGVMFALQGNDIVLRRERTCFYLTKEVLDDEP